MVDVTVDETTYEVTVDETTYDISISASNVISPLNDLTDVNISSPIVGEGLIFNGVSWENQAGSGSDMTKVVYDPTGVNGDAFDMDNMVEGSSNLILTSSERSAIGVNNGKVGVTDQISNVVEDLSPQLGGDLDLNGKFLTVEKTAGEAVVAGDVCYLKSDGKYWKADASAEATADTELLIATESISADATGTFGVPGYEWTTTGLTAGKQYLSETAGGITATAPTTSAAVIRIVGTAVSTTVFRFNPSQSYGVLA